MRVTASTFSNSLVDQLNRLAIRQYGLQNQAATGQKVALPEDNPGAIRRILDMQAEAGTLAQFRSNIDRHQELAGATYNSIKALKTLSDRAGEIATSVDDLKSRDELNVLATEINELIRQGVQLANSSNRGDYLFAGTRTDQPPFVITEDANGLVTGVAYQGNTTLAESEISENETITAQTLGANTTGAGPRGLITDARSGADFFNHLVALRDHLLAGDTAAVAGDRANLAADEDNIIIHLGTNGAVQARLETAKAVATSRSESVANLISKEVDADLAQTLVRLNETQTAYQAALQSGGTILNRSLLDFLR